MIMSKCILCGSHDAYEFFDERVCVCKKHFKMFLANGLLKEGPDDLWHFINESDLKLF